MSGNSNNLTPLENVLGQKLIKNDGEEIATNSLTLSAKKQIVLYFSAHWCPPCKGFTPVISKAYDEYKQKVGDKSEVEFIFISRDEDAETFAEYHKEMSFPAIPFDADRDGLAQKFAIEGIPSLVAINQNGERINESIDFRSLISVHGAGAFPLTAGRASELKAEEKEMATKNLKNMCAGNIPFPLTTSNKKVKSSLREVMSKADNVAILLGDGDFSDASYDTLRDVMNKVNSKTGDRCAVIYLGLSLYNSDSDHQKLSEKFDFALNEASEELKEAIGLVVGKENAQAPTIAIIRRGTGLCGINGKCEDEDTPILVAVDPGLVKIRQTSAEYFPWNEEAMKAFVEVKKIKIEKIKSNLVNMKFLTEPEGEKDPVVLQKEGTAPLKERIFVDNGNEECVVGLYFSAHWCPPCRNFTPKLVECYEKVRAVGGKFEVIFVSSDSSKADFESYYESMKTTVGDQFLALDFEKRDLKNNLSDAFDVSGIPTLILLKPDGTVISEDGVSAISEGGADAFPWDKATIERVASEKLEIALKREKSDEESQRSLGTAVVKRLAGIPEHVNHDINTKVFTLGPFSTVGAPDLFADSGIVYYELEILEDKGCTQFGFALKDGIEQTYKDCSEGVGDDSLSWGLDGFRSIKWHGDDGDEEVWEGKWAGGNIIGFAVNIEKGMIAASRDGDWTKDGFGLMFRNDSIKKGVFPCFSGQGTRFRYCFDQDGFKYGLPTESIWNVSEDTSAVA